MYQCTSQFLASCSALAARQTSGGPRGQPVSILCGMDRVMLYNMNVWSRQDRVLKLDRAMLYNMNGQCRHDSVHGDQSTCNADVDRLNNSDKKLSVNYLI